MAWKGKVRGAIAKQKARLQNAIMFHLIQGILEIHHLDKRNTII